MKTMKSGLAALAVFLLLVKIADSQNVTLEGHAFLEFQQTHDNIKVKAERIAPSYLSDSAYSDYTGFYSLETEAGIYSITFTKEGYIDLQLPEMPVYNDTVLCDQTLETIGLNGALTGLIQAGIYKVSGDIFIPQNEILEIKPGTILKFKQDVKFEVFGELSAAGASEDSIKFTHYADGISWKGIDFKENSSALSILNYCIIEYSSDRGISVFKCSPSISNSLIQNNSHNTNVDGQEEEKGGGAGLCLKNSNSVVKNVIVRNNTGITIGCGIYCSNGSPYISNSLIINNTNPSAVDEMRPGGGIHCSYETDLVVENSVICYNNNSIGGGICLGGFQGIYIPKVTVANSIIYGNSVQGEYCFGGGIATYNETVLTVNNSAFWDNAGGNISCDDPWLCVNVTVNNNMDSCDAYGNIQMDPFFVNPGFGDFSLNSDSPCVDAGDNSFVTSLTDFANCYRIWDGNDDSDSIVDMGAFEYGSQSFPVGINGHDQIGSVKKHIYPNPSDKVIHINSEGFLKVEIYDLAGKIVLSSGSSPLDISELKSGFYVVKIIDSSSSEITQRFIKR